VYNSSDPMKKNFSNIKTKSSSRAPIKFYNSVHFKFSLAQIFMLLFIVGTTLTILYTIERKALLDQGYELAEQLGNRVVSQLQKKTQLTESLVVSLANLGEILGSNEAEIVKAIPHLLNYENEESFIAGGGVWPEPFAFNKDIERKSFFWGRDKEGVLQYYDDYNDPTGSGYHHEEWYVPAKYYPPGGAFWSKSYMDPYSYQPMVTCTVPMYKDSKLYGVTTVDLKLEGLQSFFEESAKVVDGYIFAVDRNNKLLSFPNSQIAKSYTPDGKGGISEEFLYMESLSKKMPSYNPISETLDEINANILKLGQSHQENYLTLSKNLDKESYQINSNEAKLTAAILSDPLKNFTIKNETMEMKRLFIDDDPLLHKNVMVSVFHMPGTYWKIIVVTPTSKFLSLADDVTKKIAFYIVGLELLALLILFFISQILFIRPVLRMTHHIKKAHSSKDSLNNKLDDSSKDEFGMLAHEFNTRTDHLLLTLKKLDQAKENLEEKVEKRTKELNSVHMQLLQSEKMASIGQLAAGVAHEINNPVGFIGGNVDMLKKYIVRFVQILKLHNQLKDQIQNNESKKIQESIQEIEITSEDLDLEFILNDSEDLISETQEGLERIRKIVLDLKVFVRAADDSETEEQIEEIIDSISNLIHSEMRYKAKLIKEYGKTPKIKCNAQKLGQVFINLLINAAQAIDKDSNKKEVHVKTRTVKNNVVIEITDTGKGIPQDKLSKIFDPFFTTKPVGEGTGLGLSISHEIIKTHNGEIEVSSKENVGTTFTITLPIIPSALLV
jgi:signal transduction histidine kinase